MKPLELRDVTVRRGERVLVGDINLQIAAGSLFGLIGPNGAGKSSLLRAIAQLLPHAGQCSLGAQSLEQSSAAWRARRLAYLAQSGELAWPMSVRDFIALGRLPHQGTGLPLSLSWRRSRSAESVTTGARSDHPAVMQALERTGLVDLAQRRLDQLSGGEMARARLARALAVEADVLLADEPCASLDPFHQLSVMELLRSHSRQGRVVVVVLHDLTLASRFCDQLLMLHQGAVVSCGEPRQVLTPDNLQKVYQLQAIHGVFRDQTYIVPWQSSTPAGHADSMNKADIALQDEMTVR